MPIALPSVPGLGYDQFGTWTSSQKRWNMKVGSKPALKFIVEVLRKDRVAQEENRAEENKFFLSYLLTGRHSLRDWEFKQYLTPWQGWEVRPAERGSVLPLWTRARMPRATSGGQRPPGVDAQTAVLLQNTSVLGVGLVFFINTWRKQITIKHHTGLQIISTNKVMQH